MLTRSTLRAFSTDTLKVIHNVAKQQFVVKHNDSDEAAIDYDESGNKIILIHTEVPEIFQGKGVGKLLAKHAFNYAVEKSLDVTCQCTFLWGFYEKNKDHYKSLKITKDFIEV